MKTISNAQAKAILASAFAHAREQKFKPLGIAVLDVRGSLIAYEAEDGSSLGRYHVAIAKASGCIEMGFGSRALQKRAAEAPVFAGALNAIFPNGAIPVPGGVLVRTAEGEVAGAVGVSGDTSDNDEAAALAGIAAAGFTGETGA
jgi:uncharacterized protein GlcG (DUF336 family)